jgi:hypothetical protein
MAEMTLNEAIEHLYESLNDPAHNWSCEECKHEHEQLLAWLNELDGLRNAKKIDKTAKYVYGDADRDEDTEWHYCSHCRTAVDISYSDYEYRGRKIREAFGDYCPCCGYKMIEVEW